MFPRSDFFAIFLCSYGISLPFILFRADWPNNKTFKKFYNNPLLLKLQYVFSKGTKSQISLKKLDVTDV